MRKLVAGTGWKMNIGAAMALRYATELRPLLSGIDTAAFDLFILPPFTSLAAAKEGFMDSGVGIGGQNVHWETSGAWTGEVSAPMLVEAGCRYVELAHSERLQYFGETYELVRLKLNSALGHGLTPILCLGETAEDRRLGRSDAVLAEQLQTALTDQPGQRVPEIILAYEPRWAIGMTEAATPDYIAARHDALRDLIGERWGGAAASRTRIIYGGSVSPSNGSDLIAPHNVDGLFVGRAAWSPQGFARIVAIVSEAVVKKGHQT